MKHKHARGYTLIELLVVLAVMALLAGMAMPLAELNVQRAKERELKRALWEIRDAIDAWQRASAQGAIATAPGAYPYPPSLAALAQPQLDQRPDRSQQTMRFLRRLPRDPFADPALPAEQSWGQRGYRFEADAPQPGHEVYDVYSRSTVKGLNGVLLAHW